MKAGDPLVQLNDAPERGDLASFQAQARWAQTTLQRSAALAQRQFEARETVDQKQSQLDQARAQIDKTEAVIAQKLIRAPFAGQLGMRQIEVGQYLTPGAPIVTLTDLSTLYVNFTLPARRALGRSAVGQKVDVTADAFAGRTFTAEITTIEPQVSADTRTMSVQATMSNPEKALLPGMFVNAAVVLSQQPDVTVLPETAVDYTLYGDSVYVIHEDGRARTASLSSRPCARRSKPAHAGATRWRSCGAQARRTGRRRRPGQVAERRTVVVTGSPPPQPPAQPTRN